MTDEPSEPSEPSESSESEGKGNNGNNGNSRGNRGLSFLRDFLEHLEENGTEKAYVFTEELRAIFRKIDRYEDALHRIRLMPFKATVRPRDEGTESALIAKEALEGEESGEGEEGNTGSDSNIMPFPQGEMDD